MNSKLNLDQKKIENSRNAARKIAEETQRFIEDHTTISVERTVVRLLGVDNVNEIEEPLPNVLVDNIKDGGGLQQGAAFWVGNAMVQKNLTPQEIASSDKSFKSLSASFCLTPYSLSFSRGFLLSLISFIISI
ncbi:MAG: lysine 5,6-aminomutase subunit alpha, partial [Eubacteriales bacterium]